VWGTYSTQSAERRFRVLKRKRGQRRQVAKLTTIPTKQFQQSNFNKAISTKQFQQSNFNNNYAKACQTR
jgi:hypothetical protein